MAAQLLDEWCGGWKLVSWELAEEQMFVVAKDESGGPVKARGVVIIAAAGLPHLRAYFHLHLLGHASHFILFCLLISRSLNGDHGACVSLINSPMTAQLQNAARRVDPSPNVAIEETNELPALVERSAEPQVDSSPNCLSLSLMIAICP